MVPSPHRGLPYPIWSGRTVEPVSSRWAKQVATESLTTCLKVPGERAGAVAGNAGGPQVGRLVPPALGLLHYMINFRGDARTPGTSDLAAVAVPGQHLRPQPLPSGRVSRGSRRASGDHDQQHGRGQRPMPVLRARQFGIRVVVRGCGCTGPGCTHSPSTTSHCMATA